MISIDNHNSRWLIDMGKKPALLKCDKFSIYNIKNRYLSYKSHCHNVGLVTSNNKTLFSISVMCGKSRHKN